MIIKKVNIISFGALKNKIVEFNRGFNIIYGENEAGKSTIESFIKIWLYGFSNSRGRDIKSNERLKYAPISGENLRGELFIEIEDKEYIISRTFGKTKKDDTCTIIDTLTGEAIQGINIEEPGREFLRVNRSTFTKTLFIGQLDVGVKKDKEEEILDKISNVVGVGEGDVTVDKAFLKLENYKKELTTSRKTGKLDILKEKISNLKQERYDGYKLADHNLENEENLLKLKSEREILNKELSNLEIYKKYLKKIKLQREYEDLTKYLRKREELKKEEKFITSSLTYNDEVITSTLVNDIKEEHGMYLSLLDIKEEDEEKLKDKKHRLDSMKEPFNRYKYIELLNDDALQELMKLQIEQENLNEKISICKNIDNEIETLNIKQEQAREYIGLAYNIKPIRSEVGEKLAQYEQSLKDLKYSFEKKSGPRKEENYKKLIVVIIAIITIIVTIFTNNQTLKIVFVAIGVSLGVVTLSNDFIKRKIKNGKIKTLKASVNDIEKILESYNKVVGVSDYGQLIKKVKLYDEYVLLKEKIDIKISEKLSQKNILEINKVLEQYSYNEDIINGYREISGISSITEIIQDINKYHEISKDFLSLEIAVKNGEESLLRIEEQVKVREERIKERLKPIGLQDENLFELGSKLVELKEKITQREEISRSLTSIDNTYQALTKGKDINVIKEELKDVINLGFKYSYESEEEIDEVVKQNSKRLLEVEKEIKDVENEISNRYKGKRTLPEIEEEIEVVESQIIEDEKKLEAACIAKEVLKEAYDEIRENFGPILNKSVVSAFKDFTDNKYNEVMVSDKYEMKVVKENETMSSDLLSNGTNDQLFLALRLAFIDMIFNNKNITLYLDDAFVQYDDKRVEKILTYLYNEGFAQVLIFTCQKREQSILMEKSMEYTYILL